MSEVADAWEYVRPGRWRRSDGMAVEVHSAPCLVGTPAAVLFIAKDRQGRVLSDLKADLSSASFRTWEDLFSAMDALDEEFPLTEVE